MFVSKWQIIGWFSLIVINPFVTAHASSFEQFCRCHFCLDSSILYIQRLCSVSVTAMTLCGRDGDRDSVASLVDAPAVECIDDDKCNWNSVVVSLSCKTLEKRQCGKPFISWTAAASCFPMVYSYSDSNFGVNGHQRWLLLEVACILGLVRIELNDF